MVSPLAPTSLALPPPGAPLVEADLLHRLLRLRLVVQVAEAAARPHADLLREEGGFGRTT